MQALKSFLQDLPGQDAIQHAEIQDKALFITAPLLDYERNIEWQHLARDFVKENKSLGIFIFCSHPFLFTMGRGLQKQRGQKIEGLKEFNPDELPQTLKDNIPIHKINRGGGLTFHYPGQLICYPILNLSSSKWTLSTITWGLLEAAKMLGEEVYGAKNLEVKKDPLGVWREGNKYASLGIGVERFCTQHGIAINLFHDDSVFSSLQMINPCGLQGPVYSSFEKLSGTKGNWNELTVKFREILSRNNFC